MKKALIKKSVIVVSVCLFFDKFDIKHIPDLRNLVSELINLKVQHFSHFLNLILFKLFLVGLLVLELHVIRSTDGEPVKFPVLLLIIHKQFNTRKIAEFWLSDVD